MAIKIYGNISTETMAKHEWVKHEDHLSEMKCAEEKIRNLREALNELVDDEPCQLNHEGFCQAHGLSKPCSMVKARAVLGES